MSGTATQSAIASHHTSIVDCPWDGTAAVARMKSAANGNAMYAYMDAAEKYHLPHHEVTAAGEPGAANINACIAGIAVLNNAALKGITAEERVATYNHLAGHIRDAGMIAPVLKTDLDALPDSLDECTVERVQCSAVFMEKDAVGTDFFVRGFASMNSEDRDGDAIDPTLFDTKTFLANPQLWVNHMLWKDTNGNGHAVGSVVEAVPVKVEMQQNAKTMDLLYLTGESVGKVYRAAVPTDDLLEMKNGDRGLWVVVKVDTPEVQTAVTERRLNAFSWQGLIHRRKNGAVARIDLFEVSLVNVPAHQRGLLQIGKTLYVYPMQRASVVVLDTHAIASLTPGQYAGSSPLSETEEKLLNNSGGTPDHQTQEGGDNQMTPEQQKALDDKLNDITKTLGVISEVKTAVDALGTRMDAVEAAKTATTTADDAAKAAQVEADAKAAQAAKDAATAAAQATGNDDISKKLDSIAEALKGVDAIKTAVESLDTRMKAVEGAPGTSKAASDENGGGDDDMTATVQKALNAMTPQERHAVQQAALARVVVPAGVLNR